MLEEYYDAISLFDGMGCGRIAFDKLGITPRNYYASEIKSHAIKVAKKNFPDIQHIGDILKIDFNEYKHCNILIGGSPCQNFSRGNKERKGLDGEKSKLFFKWYEAFQIIKPKYFLLENVIMDIEDQNYISELLGVQPIRINSSLVSGQLRDRLYWTNIPSFTTRKFWNLIEQPKDKDILLSDILESGYCPLKKARCLMAGDSRPHKTPLKIYHRTFNKAFGTSIFKNERHYFNCADHYEKHHSGKPAEDFDMSIDNSVYDGIRYPTKSEREKLQTVPTGYCDCLTDNQAADLLGDGWTIDVIVHIMQGLKGKQK